MEIKEVRHLLTYRCNLRCRHCYLDAKFANNKTDGGEDGLPAFSQDDFDRFYLFYEPGVVSATGGEPLLRPDLVKMIARSTALYGGAMELVTNGFFLTEEFVRELNGINPGTFYQISLDGAEKFHNHLRGHSLAYSRAMRAINIASRSGALTKVRLTAMNENFSDIAEVIRVLDSFGRKNIRLVIRPALCAGRAKKNGLRFDAGLEEFRRFGDCAVTIGVETTDNAGKCGCGTDTIAVDPAGAIFPCTYFVFDEKYRMGDIRGNFADISEQPEFGSFEGACYARYLKKQLPVSRPPV